MLAISCGVDRAHYAGPSAEAAGRPAVLFVGRLDAEKNVHELLEATVALPPEVRVELVGDGSERARLEALAARLGIAERVTFHGFVPDEELVRPTGGAPCSACPAPPSCRAWRRWRRWPRASRSWPPTRWPCRTSCGPGTTAGSLTRRRRGPGRPAHRRLAPEPAPAAATGQASLELIAAHDLGASLDAFDAIYRDALAQPASEPVLSLVLPAAA